jgi:poly-gamma-glutamate capsule biosynthesis protein CapA/YwtB (metallophosphatase superfamily)
MVQGKLSLYAVGDIRIMREKDPEFVLERVASILKQGDITFAQLEGNLAEHGSPQGGFANVMLAPRSSVSALTSAGINVMSVASNHSGDYGPEALLESLDWLRQHDIQPVGAGANLDAAREPVIFERNGMKVAFLAYVSVVPWGHEAGPKRPGSAPMRVNTYYRQMDWQPGTPPLIVTVPEPEDVANMEEDVRKVRGKADYVIVSLHWGIHNTPIQLADYEPVVGRAAIDAGADMVLGHHAHILKAIEFYKGKPIFYCLGDFSVATKYREGYEDYQHTVDKVYGRQADPNYSFHSPISSDHQKKTVIVQCEIAGGKLESITLIPGQPHPIDRAKDGALWDEWYDFVVASCRGVGCDTELVKEDGAVRVRLPAS